MKEPEMIIVTPERTAIEQAIAETIVREPGGETDGIDHRVLDGARILDRTVPGWADKINLDRFDICDGADCVLGQVYGDYFGGVRQLFNDPGGDKEDEHGYRYGFVGDDDGDSDEAGADWRTLQIDWEKVIAERQK